MRVSIDLSKQLYVGDSSELDRNKFFNIHSSPGEPGAAEQDMLYIRNELNAQYGRVFWGPMALSGSANYPDTQQAILDGEQSIANSKTGAFYEFGTNRIVATEHPRSVLVQDNDPVEGARWAADYFEYYFEDDRRPLFYEPMNEPFVHASDFVDGPWDPVANEAVQRHMANWFAEIGKEFAQRGLNTNVIGFSSAWPSFELSDFSHWQSRQKMFMDVAGDHMDGFSFHLYDGVNVAGQDNFRSGSNAEAIIDMIEAYSHIKWGEVKAHAVTEYGGIIDGYPLEYSAAKSAQELRSYNHILFSLLEREDRILTSTPFITGISKWFYDANNFNPYSAAVLRPDPDKITSNKVNGYLPTEKAYFYQLWSDVKGNRMAVDFLDPDIAVQAFNYGNKLYLALNNYEDGNKVVDLFFLNQSHPVLQVRAKRLDVPYAQGANYTDKILPTTPPTITMAGHETIVLEYIFADPISPEGIVRKSNYYAQSYLQPIVENIGLSFTFNNIDVEEEIRGFADAYKGLEFDQSVVDAIKPNEVNRLTSTMRSFDRQLTSIISKFPDEWRDSAEFARLTQRAERSPTTAKALQYHYALHGYNASDRVAMLKMGIGRKHDKSKQPKVLVNGHEIDVPNDWRGYDQVSRDDFFGVIEIPVPAKFLKPNTEVELVFPDSQGHVSSLILEVDKQEPLQSVAVSGVEMQNTSVAIKKDRPYRLFANVLPQSATNKFLRWHSSDESIAKVDEGLVTPVSPGVVVISAHSDDGEYVASTNVEVKDELTVRNTIVITNDVSSMAPTNSITLDIDYSTSIERDVAFELISPEGNWLGLSTVTVPGGEGSTQVTLSFSENLASGKGYKIIAALREVGGDWRTSVDGHTITGVEITSTDTTPNPVNNLLGINGDFEQGSLGDWQLVFGSNGALEIIQDAAYSGNYGIKFDTSDGRVGISIDETVLPHSLIKAGKKFKLSFYLKRLSTGAWSGGMSQFINLDGGWKSSGQKWFGGTLTGEWQLVEIEFDGVDWPDTQTSFEVNLMTSGHTWYADDFILEDITQE
ncbi:MAG: Ig-like domain-containing protein [Paraglaciecola sp.]|uniref:Ig-like domain-containing protein n=1 Tax=Paraglaciecola sp. TaxID=1920173 RepID=UPI0032991EEC